MSTFKEKINSDIPTLVDFYAPWCGPCKTMMPVLDALKERLGDKINILKVDVDKNEEAAKKFKIMGVPTFILFINGDIKWRQPGTFTLNQLLEIVKSHS
ncbi:MAG: thioredoxin family protein [Saprospiraceae bacterium]|nr:thioredoxin family protein [Saprospiraceae bacterium]